MDYSWKSTQRKKNLFGNEWLVQVLANPSLLHGGHFIPKKKFPDSFWPLNDFSLDGRLIVSPYLEQIFTDRYNESI